MALVDPAAFDGKEVAMIYIAGRLSEAKRVEEVLLRHAIDYAVDAEPFESRVLGILPVVYEGVGLFTQHEGHEGASGSEQGRYAPSSVQSAA